MKKIILVLLVMMITLVPVLLSCQPSEPTLTPKAKASTDDKGVAVLEFDGQKLAVFAANETSPSQAVPDIDVSVAEQQGTGLIYAADTRGDFLPAAVSRLRRVEKGSSVLMRSGGRGMGERGSCPKFGA